MGEERAGSGGREAEDGRQSFMRCLCINFVSSFRCFFYFFASFAVALLLFCCVCMFFFFFLLNYCGLLFYALANLFLFKFACGNMFIL